VDCGEQIHGRGSFKKHEVLFAKCQIQEEDEQQGQGLIELEEGPKEGVQKVHAHRANVPRTSCKNRAHQAGQSESQLS
jgi:hypothetical protein